MAEALSPCWASAEKRTEVGEKVEPFNLSGLWLLSLGERFLMGKGKEKVKELNPGPKWFPDPKATQTALQNRREFAAHL